jgi:hypothetical protein
VREVGAEVVSRLESVVELIDLVFVQLRASGLGFRGADGARG